MGKIIRVVGLTLWMIISMLVGYAQTPTLGDYQSVGSGNWSDLATWQRYTSAGWGTPTAGEGYPGQFAGTDDVWIQDGHTVTINVSPDQPISGLYVGKGTSGVLQYEAATVRVLTVSNIVRINRGGTFRCDPNGTVSTHQLIVDAGIVNEGTLNFSSNNAGVGITFTGNSSGLFDLSAATLTNLMASNGLLLNKGNNVLSFTPGGIFQVRSANVEGFLTIQSGTFSLMGTNAFSNPLFYASSGSYTIPSGGGFQLNNHNANISGIYGTLTNNGNLIIRDGVFNVGDGTGNESLTTSTGRFEMSGGEMNISGRFRIDGGNCIISGGEMNLATIGHADRTLAAFHISGSAGLAISGSPLITFAFPNSNTTPFNDLEIVAGSGIKTITGGTFQLGTAATPSSRPFLVNSDIPLYNMVVYTANTRVVLSDHLSINNQLTLNGQLQMNNYNLNIGSSAIVGDLRTGHGMILSGTGQIHKTINAPGTYLFPFGTGGSSSTYIPVNLTFTGGSFSPGATVSVGMTASKHPQNVNTTNYLQRYWTVQTVGITNPVYNFTGTYATGDVFGNDYDMTTGVYTTTWRKLSATNNIGYTIYASGLTENVAVTGINAAAAAPVVTVTANPAAVCSGSTVQLTATATGDGPFTYSWTPIADLNNPSIYNPVATPIVTLPTTITYRVTVTDGMGESVAGSVNVPVNPPSQASVTIVSSDADNIICAGTGVTFTATPVNGGTPSYQWYQGTTPVGTDRPEYTTTNLTSGQPVTVEMTSTAACVTGNPAISNVITTTVNPQLPVSITIDAPDNSVCAGTAVTFTAHPVNQGDAPVYQWRVNGNSVGDGNTTYAYIPSNGDVVSCVLTSNAPCTTGNPAISNALTMVVYPLPTATISGTTEVCQNSSPAPTITLTNSMALPVIITYNINGGGTTTINVAANSTATVSQPTATPGGFVYNLISVAYQNAPTCSNSVSGSATVTVNPTPTVNVIANQTYCNGFYTSAIIPGPVGTNFTWTNSNPAIGLDTSGSGNIPSFLTTNGTDVPISSLITVTPTVKGCVGTPIAFTITVNPTPTVNTLEDRILCNNTTAPGISLSGPVNGTTFTWTNSNPAIGLAASGSGNIPQFQAINRTNSTLEGIITVTPTANGCVGTPQTFTITVKPTLTASIAGTATVCQFDESPSITFTNPMSVPVTITYRRNSIAHAINVAANSTNTVAVPTNTADTYIYELVTVAYQSNPTCSNNIIGSATVVVNPRANSVPTPGTQAVCSGQAITPIILTSSTAGVTYTWTRNNTTTVTGIANSGSGNISGTLTNTTSSSVAVTFTITANNGGCDGTPETATVTVYPTPVPSVVPAAQTRCSGEAIGSIVPSSTTGGTTFTWTRDHVTEVTGLPASGTGPVPTISLTNTTNSSVTVTFIFTPTANNCVGSPIRATVTIRPKASIRNLTASICNSGTFTVSPVNGVDGVVPPGTNYSWRVQSATAGITGAASGSGSIISGTLGNATNFTQSVTYAVTPSNDGCVGELFLLTVTVTPQPAITNIVRNVCSGNSFTVSPVNGTDGIVPTGTTYSWSAPSGGVSGGQAGSGSSITGTLINSTLTPQTATYTVTPVSGTCTGNPFTLTVTVNPDAAVTPMTASVCSGGGFTVTPVNVTNGVVPTGTTYSWAAPAVTGGVTGGAPGSGATGISGILTNPTSTVQMATYTVTPSSGGCAGAPFTVTVTINPIPAVTPMSSILCSGGNFNLIPVDGTNGRVPAGTTYSWTAPNVTGITGTASGTNATGIAGQLYNTSGTARNVTYTVTPSAGGCAGSSFSVIVTVNPAPSATDMSATVCSGASFTVTPVNGTNGTIPPGTTYSWSAPTVTGGITGGAPGSGTANISGTLTNSTNTVQTATYTITPSSGSCAGNSFSLTVTVNPVPSVSISGNAEVCYGGTAPNLTFTNQVNLPVTVSYNINGGANFSVNIAASGTTSIPATVNQEGTFNYNLVSVAYQSAPACSIPANGTAILTVRPITTVAISRTPSGTICYGESVTFTSNVANAGTNPSYQWYLNGVAILGETGISYTSTTLNNSDKVRLIVTTNTTPCPGPITSNEITMTVNPSVTPSVTIYESANPICAGASVTFTANTPVNGGTAPIYQWQLNGSNVGSNSPTFTTSTLVDGDQVSVILTSNANCAVNPATSNTVTMTVDPVLIPSVNISVPQTTICPGASLTFTAASENGGTIPTYQWKLNGGNVGTNSPTYTTSTLVNGDIVSVVLTSNATCASPVTATSNSLSITVTPGSPAMPGAITGLTSVCPGNTGLTYSIASVTNATNYVWRVPSGWSITAGQNTNSITVTGGTTGDNGNITVSASNNCGTSTARTLAVTIGDLSIEPTGITVTNNNSCFGITKTLSVSGGSLGTGAVWEWFTGSCGGTLAGTGNSIMVNPAAGTTTTYWVRAAGACNTTNCVQTDVLVNPAAPSQPGAITGTTSVCPIAAGLVYSIAAVPNANVTGYTWSVPTGWAITAGQGTTAITVTSGTTGQNGNISVTASNSCGTSTPSHLTVTVNPGTPAMPGTITGSSEQCINTSGKIYSIVPVTNATSYTWNVPSGWTITAGANTNSITVSTNGTASSGNITVIANNSCGASAESILPVTIVTDVPNTPGEITGLTAICPAKTITYSLNTTPGAIDYIWSFPVNWVINSGQGSRSVTVTVPSNGGSGNISVYARNVCGNSNPTTLAVTVAATAWVNAGADRTVCVGTPSVTLAGSVGGAINNANEWDWVLLNGGTIPNADQGKLNAIYNLPNGGNTPGTYTVRIQSLVNRVGCDQTFDEMTVTVLPIPTVNAGGPDVACQSATPSAITLTGASVGGGGGLTTGAWSVVSGGGTLSSIAQTATPATITYTPAANFSGTVTLRLTTNTPGNCAAVNATRTITINTTPTVNAGGAISVCQSATPTPIVLTGASVGGGATTGTWSVTTGGGTLSNTAQTATPATVAYTPAPNFSGTVTLTLTTNAPVGCSAVSATRTITVNPTPTVNAGGSDVVCQSATPSAIVLSGATLGGGATTGAWSVVSGGGTLSSTAPTATPATVTYTPAANFSGTVTLRLTTNTPPGGCAAVTAERTITVNPAPTVNPGSPDVVCQSATPSPITLTGATVGGGATTGAWSVVSGGGTLSSTAQTATPATITYTPVPNFSGTVTLTLTTNAPTGCSAVSATRTITVNPTPTVNAGGPDVVCQSASPSAIVLSGATLGGGATTGAWSVVSGGGTLSSTAPTATPATVTYTPAANFSGTVTLRLTTNTSGGCTAVTADRTITVNPAPTVSAGPPQTICSGSTVTLAGSISGGATRGTWTGGGGTFNPDRNTLNASYTPSGAEIAAGTVTLTLTTTDHSAPCGAVSATITITIHRAVVITTQPINTGACVGTSASLHVIANSMNLSYQWYKGTVPGTPILGATSSTLTFNSISLTDEGSYYVVVTGDSPCPPVTSNIVSLNVDAAIAITSQPTNQTRCVGEDVTFSVIADAGGAPLTYQWRKNGVNISGANLSTYSITGITSVADAGSYDVVVGSSAGFNCSSVTSSAGTLTVNENGTISLTGDDNQTLCANSPIASITYTIGGSSTGAVLTGFLPDGITHSFSGGVFTLSGTPTEQGTFNYTVSATGSSCLNPSLSGTITVNGMGTISLGGGTATPTVCVNNPLPAITYSIGGNATGATIPPGSIPPGVTGVYANGLFTISGTPTAAGTYPFTVSTTGSACGNPSLSGTITVNGDATIALTSANANQTICIGSPISPISYTIGGSATGAVLTGQLPAGVTGSISGNVYTISGTPTATGTFNYSVTTTGACSNTLLNGVLQVDYLANGGFITPAVSTVCTTTNNGTLTLENYSGNIIQWEYSTDGGNTWIVDPVTTSTYHFTNLPNTTLFTALVGNESCPALYSGIARVTVIPAFTPTITVSGGDVCSGEPVTLTATAVILPQTSGVITGGDFNQSNPRGWRVTYNGAVASPFPASGNNTNPAPWSLTNQNKTFCGNATFSSGDRKFSVVNGALRSTMETPVFSLVAMSSAELTFRHAYSLLGGATARVEISTDGGNTYNQVLAEYSGTLMGGNPNVVHPVNFDLSPYLGMSNLRIRFNYSSTACDAWAIDDITLPAPQPDVDYSWGPVDLIPGGSGSTVVVLPPTTTTYTLTVWIAGCPGVATAAIVSVVNTPEVQTTNACVGGGPVTFTHSSPVTGGTWTVSGGGSITSGGVFTPTEPGCFEATYTTPNSACSGTASFVVFPAAPAPTVNGGCGPIVVTPPPAINGFNVEYSFDNGAHWGPNVPPTEESCNAYYIKTRYVSASLCDPTPVGEVSSNPVCSESPATVRTIDYSDPTFTVPADITIYKDAVCNYDASPGVTGDVKDEYDNCPDNLEATYTDVIVPGACEDELIIERTWILEDGCGKQNVQIQRITVSDNTPPVISSPAANAQSNCSMGNPNDNPGYQAWLSSRGGAAATDNCDQIVTWSDNSATQFWNGVTGNDQIVITWVATDNCGNGTETTATYSITDTEAPTVVCPDHISETALLNNCGKILVTPSDPTINDNCSATVLSYTLSGATIVTTPVVGTVAGVTFNVGETTVTYTATDAAGNVSEPCSFTVTILDVTPPSLTIGGCVNVEESAAANNCSKIPVTIIDPTYSDACWPHDSLTLSWTMSGATTGTGNGSVVGQTFNVGVTTVTYQVEDPDGNKATCSFNVTILRLNIPPPAIICPDSPDPVTAATGTCFAFVTVASPVEVDPCETITYSFVNDFNRTDNASGSYPVGSTIVTWTITDNSGNKITCQQTVVVNDLPPTITCPAPIVVQADFELPYQDAVTIPEPSYGDNCPNPVLSWIMVPPVGYASEYEPGELSGTGPFPSPSLFYLGITTITYIVTDADGHTATCSFTVSVLTEPEITCLEEVPYNTDPEQCTATRNSSAYGLPTLVRGLQPITWTWTITNPDGSQGATGTFNGSQETPGPPAIPDYAFQQGTSTITWRAENVSGFDDCTQNITVHDNQAPTFTVPSSITRCVESILWAVYNPNPTVGIVPEYDDLSTPRPDYYLFTIGDGTFDLDAITNNFNENCCADENLTIHWRIDFAPTPNPATADHEMITKDPITGIGQPSLYTQEIQFPGDGVTFHDVIHQFSYWLVDCHENASPEQHVQIIIQPRPQLTKVN